MVWLDVIGVTLIVAIMLSGEHAFMTLYLGMCAILGGLLLFMAYGLVVGI